MQKRAILLTILALLVLFTLPACASEQSAVRNTTDGFLKAFQAGDADTSYGYFNDEAQQTVGGLENWTKAINAAKESNALPTSWSISDITIKDTIAVVSGDITTLGKKHLSINLEKIDGTWKIVQMRIK